MDRLQEMAKERDDIKQYNESWKRFLPVLHDVEQVQHLVNADVDSKSRGLREIIDLAGYR
jgi:hypothetical protein